MYNSIENQFAIPVENMDELKVNFAKLNKRGKRFDWPEVSFEVVDHYVESVHDEINDIYHYFHYDVVEVHGETVKLSGWTFLGSLDHVSVPGTSLVKSVPGVEFPKQYIGSDNVCDHCGQRRDRHNTFVLQNTESKEYMRVGSACVKDFIGHDPKSITRYLEWMHNLTSEMRDTSGYVAPEYSLETTLAATNNIIDSEGWLSRTKARESEDGLTATADMVGWWLDPANDSQKDFKKLHMLNHTDHELAAKAIEWIKNKESDGSEYQHNVKAIANYGYVKWSTLGFAASIMNEYRKEMTRQATFEASRKSQTNEHVGEIGKRQRMTLTLLCKRTTDTMWGLSTWHKFIDDKGRTVTWNSSNPPALKEGQTYEVKATPKDHGEYQDWKQTKVTRVALEEGAKKGDYKGFHFEKGSHDWMAWLADESGDQVPGTDLIFGDNKVDLFLNIDLYIEEGIK